MANAPREKHAMQRVRAGRCIQKRLAHERLLKRHGKCFVRDMLRAGPEARNRKLLSRERTQRIVDARYLLFAVLYHVVLQSRGQCAVAEYCGTTAPTVWNGLKKVNVELHRTRRSEFKTLASVFCARLGIESNMLHLT